MPNATYISPDGATTTLAVAEGDNLMHAAVANGIYAIVGDCGGSASCATCHVYVDPAFQAKLAAPSARELEMLEATAAERKPNSRLSCQLEMTPELDGIVVRIADCQW
jgi:2Fe-2S ferredoxin